MYKYVLASKCDPVSPMHCTLLHTLLFMEYMCTLRNRTRSLTLLLSGDLVQLYQTTSLKNWKFGVNFGPNFRLKKMIIWKMFTVGFSRLHTRKTGNVLQKNIKWEIYLNCWFDQTTLLKNWQRGVYFDPNFKLNKIWWEICLNCWFRQTTSWLQQQLCFSNWARLVRCWQLWQPAM